MDGPSRQGKSDAEAEAEAEAVAVVDVCLCQCRVDASGWKWEVRGEFSMVVLSTCNRPNDE
jgi:hypothetical protein